MWEPFGTAPANQKAYWKSGSDERSTYNILSTCILTLLLCAYTSLHLNIPEHGKSAWYQQLRKKALWVLVGIAAPELVAFVAFRDWLFARNFETDMQALLRPLHIDSTNSKELEDPETGSRKKRDSDSDGTTENSQSQANVRPTSPDRTSGTIPSGAQSEPRRFHWTRVHSHFALMGGFAFDTSKLAVNLFENNKTRQVLKPSALRLLAQREPDLVPDISEEFILDKSKANGFAKFLVCVQAVWFSAQVIGRLASGSPVSLLELNTFLHALCCLIIYVAWWNKPLDIEEPLLVDVSEERRRKICAWMVMQAEFQCPKVGPTAAVEDIASFSFPHELDLVGYMPGVSESIYKYFESGGYLYEAPELFRVSRTHNSLMNRPDEADPDINTTQWATEPTGEKVFKLWPGQTCFGICLLLQPTHQPLKSAPVQYQEVYAELSTVNVECMRLAGLLRTSDPTWKFSDHRLDLFYNKASMMSTADKTLKKWRGNPTTLKGLLKDPEKVFIAGLMFAGAIYGGIHLLAWNGPFSSLVETWMWRVSCFVIAAPLVIVPTFVKLDDWIPTQQEMVERITDKILVFLSGSFGLLYVGARIYLIVECFINMAHLPPEVYKEPEWSQYFPHFGAG